MVESTIIYAERRAKAYDLLGGACVGCGTLENLNIDHINDDRGDFKHMPNRMIMGSWDKLVEELKKCQLLCKKCHGHKTRADKGFRSHAEHGTAVKYSKGCRCVACQAAHAEYARNLRARKALAI